MKKPMQGTAILFEMKGQMPLFLFVLNVLTLIEKIMTPEQHNQFLYFYSTVPQFLGAFVGFISVFFFLLRSKMQSRIIDRTSYLIDLLSLKEENEYFEHVKRTLKNCQETENFELIKTSISELKLHLKRTELPDLIAMDLGHIVLTSDSLESKITQRNKIRRLFLKISFVSIGVSFWCIVLLNIVIALPLQCNFILTGVMVALLLYIVFKSFHFLSESTR